MEFKLNPNSVNQLVKGTQIYSKGDSVFSIALVLKGRVLMQNDGAKVIMGTGAFLGVNDLYRGRYQSYYTALDDLLVYIFSINRIEEMEAVLSVNKDYHGFMVASFNKLIFDLNQIYQGILQRSIGLLNFLTQAYQEYISTTHNSILRQKAQQRLNCFQAPLPDLTLLQDKIEYYTECKKLPLDVVKAFYSYGKTITLHQVEEQVDIINQLLETLNELSDNLITLTQGLMDETDSCLFQLVALKASEENYETDVMDVLDNIVDEINKVEKFADLQLGRKLHADRKRMEEVYHNVLTGPIGKSASEKPHTQYTDKDIQLALTQMKNSYETLLNYAQIASNQAEAMKNNMLEFILMKDKLSTEDDARLIRKKITEDYYLLYKAVFLKNYLNPENFRIIDLFLTYGFTDERLLTEEQLISLYFLKEESEYGPCRVYSIKDWLTQIYEGKKEPSKNEFDLEYPELVASLKKHGKLTEGEAKKWLEDPEKKLEYEIQNMFRYNNRVASGQTATFVPVLYKEVITNDLEKLHIDVKLVNQAVEELLRIDYSIFDRELLYVNKERNITKEYIVKRIYPEIILMPTVGINAVMWQDISGKRRDSAGRFLLPIFTEYNLKSMLIKVFGRYRWEVCRTIEGVSWNDIKHKSLTSEYSDYLQFYRKNKELSEEKREKVKLQIQKGRNSSREIFVIDYEQWINYEAMGAIKLNKPVREIMATYCPFAKEIREQIKLQPLFEEAMTRYYKGKKKKLREIEARHRLLKKDQIALTQELEATLDYYRDL